MSGPHIKTKQELCRAVRHGPVSLSPLLKRKNSEHLLSAGWLRDLSEGSFELGPSCGLILSIVARRESLECAVARTDGRLIPRDDKPPWRYESTKALFMLRKPKGEGSRAGVTPQEFVTKLAGLVRKCLEHRRSASNVGFSAVCIAWPGRINRFTRVQDGRLLGDVYSYEQKGHGGWTVDDNPVSLAEHVDSALEMAGFTKGRPPILVINDADAELLALANIPREERSPSQAQIKEGSPAARAKAIYDRIGDSKVAFGITVAAGVGGALLIDGALVQGQRGFVGELGEVPIEIAWAGTKPGWTADLKSLGSLPKKKFPRWKPPHKGTLDYWASGRSILDQLWLAEIDESKYKKKETYTEELPIARKPSDPELCTATLERAGRLIGLGIISPVLTLDPGVILVSSPLPSQPIAQGIKDLLNDRIGEVNPAPDIVLPVDADPTRMLKGAARWAIQEIVDPALEKVCQAKNDSLATLGAIELTAWPRSAGRRGRR